MPEAVLHVVYDTPDDRHTDEIVDAMLAEGRMPRCIETITIERFWTPAGVEVFTSRRRAIVCPSEMHRIRVRDELVGRKAARRAQDEEVA
jgi:hypothetical protein